MPADQLQHVNIRCTDVEAAKGFYVDVIGLSVGPRPPFASVGYWLYAGAQPIVHLVQRTAADAISGKGCVDHVGLRGVDLEGTRRQLQAAGIPFREQVVPQDGTVQIFVTDPDGLKVELNFEEHNASC